MNPSEIFFVEPRSKNTFVALYVSESDIAPSLHRISLLKSDIFNLK